MLYALLRVKDLQTCWATMQTLGRYDRINLLFVKKDVAILVRAMPSSTCRAQRAAGALQTGTQYKTESV